MLHVFFTNQVKLAVRKPKTTNNLEQRVSNNMNHKPMRLYDMVQNLFFSSKFLEF